MQSFLTLLLTIIPLSAQAAAPMRAVVTEERCRHVCEDICVSESFAQRAKFSCRDKAKTACYKAHGHCTVIKGKCGWQPNNDLAQCVKAND